MQLDEFLSNISQSDTDSIDQISVENSEFIINKKYFWLFIRRSLRINSLLN